MKFYSLIAALVIVIVTPISCRVNGNPESKDAVPVLPVVKLETRDTTIEKSYVSDIQAVQNVEIRSKVPGFIDKILVDEGQEVKLGQPLFLIHDAEYQNELSKMRASLSNAMADLTTAELDLKRIKILVDKSIISKTELEMAQARIKSAEARVDEARSAEENAKIRLSYTCIRSPFSGIVDRIPLKRGSLVAEGTLITTVSDIESIYAYFNVSENEYLQFVKSKKTRNTAYDAVRLELADGSEYSHTGKVETMESEFDEKTGSIAFRAKFPNPEKILKHGATGTVKLTTSLNDALILPQKAVFEIQDKNFVFTVDADNTIRMKHFEPKTRMDEFIIVQSGLTAGEHVVYEGIQNIREGAHIIPRYVDIDSLIVMN